MKLRTVNKLPVCNFCGKDGKYDAPTVSGSWANMCQKCFDAYGRSMGATEFKLKTGEKGTKKTMQGVMVSSIEDAYTDSVIEWACPMCGDEKSMEPDAYCVVICDNCGQKYQVRGIC